MIKFLKDFLIYGFASVIGKMAAVFLMPIYTSILSKEEYGAMALIISAKGIIDLLANLNIHSGIAREYYESGEKRAQLISTGFYSILSLSTLICAAILLTNNFWRENILGLEDLYSSAFIIAVLTIPAGSLLSYFSILTRFKKKPFLYSIGTLVQLLIQIGISVYGIVYLRAGIVSLFLGMLAGELFGILFFYCINKEYIKFDFNYQYLRKALIFALPTLPAILAGWIDSSAGQVIIGKFVSKSALGEYSIALQLASVFTLINIALHNVWSPFLYENYQKTSFSNSVNALFKIIVLVLSAISITVSLLSKEIILLLSNDQYLKACEYLTILCLPMSVYLLFPIASSGISISRDTKYIGIAYVTGSLVNIVSLILLLPYLSVLAVPICLSFSRISSFMILSYVTKVKGILPLSNTILLILMASVSGCYLLVTLDIDFLYRFAILLINVLIIGAIIVQISRNNKEILRSL